MKKFPEGCASLGELFGSAIFRNAITARDLFGQELFTRFYKKTIKIGLKFKATRICDRNGRRNEILYNILHIKPLLNARDVGRFLTLDVS